MRLLERCSARRGKRRQVSVVEGCTAAVGVESRWLACCQVADDQGDADGEWNGDADEDAGDADGGGGDDDVHRSHHDGGWW